MDALAAEIKAAQKRIARLLKADGTVPALTEAYEAIAWGTHTRASDGQELNRARHALDEVAMVVSAARVDLRNKQSRPRIASPELAARIDQALRRGWQAEGQYPFEVSRAVKRPRSV